MTYVSRACLSDFSSVSIPKGSGSNVWPRSCPHIRYTVPRNEYSWWDTSSHTMSGQPFLLAGFSSIGMITCKDLFVIFHYSSNKMLSTVSAILRWKMHDTLCTYVFSKGLLFNYFSPILLHHFLWFFLFIDIFLLISLLHCLQIHSSKTITRKGIM